MLDVNRFYEAGSIISEIFKGDITEPRYGILCHKTFAKRYKSSGMDLLEQKVYDCLVRFDLGRLSAEQICDIISLFKQSPEKCKKLITKMKSDIPDLSTILCHGTFTKMRDKDLKCRMNNLANTGLEVGIFLSRLLPLFQTGSSEGKFRVDRYLALYGKEFDNPPEIVNIFKIFTPCIDGRVCTKTVVAIVNLIEGSSLKIILNAIDATNSIWKDHNSSVRLTFEQVLLFRRICRCPAHQHSSMISDLYPVVVDDVDENALLEHEERDEQIDGDSQWKRGEASPDDSLSCSSSMHLSSDRVARMEISSLRDMYSSCRQKRPCMSSDDLQPENSKRPLVSHKLVILDLNKVLICRHKRRRKRYYIRPHAREFVADMFRLYGNVAVWTSGRAENMDRVVQDIFGLYTNQLLFYWTQRECTYVNVPVMTVEDSNAAEGGRGFGDCGVSHDTVPSGWGGEYKKDLKRVWNAFPNFNKHNTVLVDDTSEKGELNPPNTLVSPEPYDVYGSDESSEEATSLRLSDEILARNGKFWKYMERLARDKGHSDDFMAANPYVA